MSAKTKISWAKSTWSPIAGCSKISEGCGSCYAEGLARRFSTSFGGKEDPFAVTFHPERLGQPLQWKKPRKIFVCSMGDLFHEHVLQEWIDEVFNIMSNCTRHTFMVLTKRPERMKTALDSLGKRWLGSLTDLGASPKWPLANVWLGVTCENQLRADERIPPLFEIPAAKRFVSVEPMLSQIDLRLQKTLPDWIVCGGESGRKARPAHPDWVRSLRDQCIAASVPFHFKSWGAMAPLSTATGIQKVPFGNYVVNHEDLSKCFGFIRNGTKSRILDGVLWDQFPGDGL